MSRCFVQSLGTISVLHIPSAIVFSQRTDSAPPNFNISVDIPSKPGALPFNERSLQQFPPLSDCHSNHSHTHTHTSSSLSAEGGSRTGEASKVAMLTSDSQLTTSEKYPTQRCSLSSSQVRLLPPLANKVDVDGLDALFLSNQIP